MIVQVDFTCVETSAYVFTVIVSLVNVYGVSVFFSVQWS